MGPGGDIPEPVQYALRDQSQPWQWMGTYEGSFSYAGLTGIEAYQRALADNYFQLAYFNGSSAISAQLMGEMPSYGFEKTATVESNGSRSEERRVGKEGGGGGWTGPPNKKSSRADG